MIPIAFIVAGVLIAIMGLCGVTAMLIAMYELGKHGCSPAYYRVSRLFVVATICGLLGMAAALGGIFQLRDQAAEKLGDAAAAAVLGTAGPGANRPGAEESRARVGREAEAREAPPLTAPTPEPINTGSTLRNERPELLPPGSFR